MQKTGVTIFGGINVFCAVIAITGIYLPWITIAPCSFCGAGPSYSYSAWDYISNGGVNPLVFMLFLLVLILLLINALMSVLAFWWQYVTIPQFFTLPSILGLLLFMFIGIVVTSGAEIGYFAGGVVFTLLFLTGSLVSAIIFLVLKRKKNPPSQTDTQLWEG